MPDFSEKSLEIMIFENRHAIRDRGFDKFYKHTERQFKLPNGGIIDLFTYEIEGDHIKFRIIELKKGKLNLAAFDQILSYFIEVWAILDRSFKKVTYECVLVGEEVDDFIEGLLMFGTDMNIFTYSFGYDGLFFKNKKEYPLFSEVTWREFKENDSYLLSSMAFINKLNK